jgi:hypothetical protein
MEPSGKRGIGVAAREIILPFGAGLAVPEPTERWLLPFIVDDVPIQFRAERWRDGDAGACPYPRFPDPRVPGESWVLTLTSLRTGVTCPPLTPSEAEAWSAKGMGRGRRR